MPSFARLTVRAGLEKQRLGAAAKARPTPPIVAVTKFLRFNFIGTSRDFVPARILAKRNRFLSKLICVFTRIISLVANALYTLRREKAMSVAAGELVAHRSNLPWRTAVSDCVSGLIAGYC